MPTNLYSIAAPAFIAMLRNMRAWLDKAAEEGDPEALAGARLAEDMKPLTAQYQFASDAAKNAIARLAGITPPVMEDTETTFAELADRCDRTIAFIKSVDASQLDGVESREVVMKFPNGMGYRWAGADYLRDFALPNFYFHATTAYAILRANGVPLGKPDFLQHLGQPEQM
ncbi:DUF1993 domain-containing protein [Tsuneonella sp. HG222]